MLAAQGFVTPKVSRAENHEELMKEGGNCCLIRGRTKGRAGQLWDSPRQAAVTTNGGSRQPASVRGVREHAKDALGVHHKTRTSIILAAALHDLAAHGG